MAKIKPTVGRIVWYYETGIAPDRPWAATIVYVHSDDCVNLMVIDPVGVPHSRTSVQLVQEDQEPSSVQYCEWMPYQKGQAEKTNLLEIALAQKSQPVQSVA